MHIGSTKRFHNSILLIDYDLKGNSYRKCTGLDWNKKKKIEKAMAVAKNNGNDIENL